MDPAKEFPEWMVTKALADHLKTDREKRLDWFFSIQAHTVEGNRQPLSELCGFKYHAEIDGGAEKALTEQDRKDIPVERFKSTFRWATADFRFWTPLRERQLIIEAKGTAKPSLKDYEQVVRYFNYLKESSSLGAVIYLVPDLHSARWLEWLDRQARKECSLTPDSGIAWGVANWREEILPKLASDLVRVVGTALTQTAELLKQALAL